MALMKANVEMIDAGIATAAISVERQDRMNNSTIKLAKMLPDDQVPFDFVAAPPECSATDLGEW